MRRSSIGWTDYSGGPLNFVRGCTPVSEGCAHCYAKSIYERFGKDFSQVTYDHSSMHALRKTAFPQDGNKRGSHSKPMCFICDTGDLFHEKMHHADIENAFSLMAARSDVTWQVLTKRPERMQGLLSYWRVAVGWQPAPNVWLGVTCENQARADERIPILLDTPAAVRFVSVEPMLGPVDLAQAMARAYTGGGVRTIMAGMTRLPRLDWVICGAESGPQRRPFDVAWALDLYEQCKAAGVPFFGKQVSGLRPGVPLVLPAACGVVWEWPKEATL